MASEIDELIELLENSSIETDIRLKGWEYILGLTVTDAGIKCLLEEKVILCILSSLKNCEKEELSLPLVYKCLINISYNKEGALYLLSYTNFVSDIILSICNPTFKFVEQVCYILNNLSSYGTFWNKDDVPIFEKNQLETLTKLFLTSDLHLKKKYRFLALIFSNITKHSIGRRFFLQNNSYLNDFFAVCANPTESVIHRLGVALTIRNCCFETESHAKLLKEVDFLSNLLLPLMGAEDYKEEEMDKFPIECQYLEDSKVREEHPKIRRTLVQALCMLCYTEEGWNYLIENGVYFITRELHSWEKDETVLEAIETLLVYLLVENYSIPDSKNKDEIMKSTLVMPSETEVVKDLPDFVI